MADTAIVEKEVQAADVNPAPAVTENAPKPAPAPEQKPPEPAKVEVPIPAKATDSAEYKGLQRKFDRLQAELKRERERGGETAALKEEVSGLRKLFEATVKPDVLEDPDSPKAKAFAEYEQSKQRTIQSRAEAAMTQIRNFATKAGTNTTDPRLEDAKAFYEAGNFERAISRAKRDLDIKDEAEGEEEAPVSPQPKSASPALEPPKGKLYTDEEIEAEIQRRQRETKRADMKIDTGSPIGGATSEQSIRDAYRTNPDDPQIRARYLQWRAQRGV